MGSSFLAGGQLPLPHACYLFSGKNVYDTVVLLEQRGNDRLSKNTTYWGTWGMESRVTVAVPVNVGHERAMREPQGGCMVCKLTQTEQAYLISGMKYV